MKKSTIVYCTLITLVLIGALLIANQCSTNDKILTFVDPPHDYRFQADNYTLYGITDSNNTNPNLIDYHFTLYKDKEQIGEQLTFRSDTRLSTSNTHNFAGWWAGGVVDCVLANTTASVQVGAIKLKLDFNSSSVQYTREYRKDMLVDLLAANPQSDKQVFEIRYVTLATNNTYLSNDIVLYDTKTEQIHYIMSGEYLSHIQFDNKDNIFASTVDGLRCFDGETGQRIDPPFEQFHFTRNCDFVDLLYDTENEVYILAWAENKSKSPSNPDETYSMRVSLIAADNNTLMDFKTEYVIPDAEIFSPLWPRLTYDESGLELKGYFEDGRNQTFLSVSKLKYLESIHDYAFSSGGYTLYGRQVPTEEMGIDYHFSFYRGNERIGNVLTFQSDTTSTYHYDRWWDDGRVDGVLADTTATVHVGYFKLALDFRENHLQFSRDYKEEMLGDLLVSSQTGEKQLYNILYDEKPNSEEVLSLTHDIVLYDLKTAQIHYLFDGMSIDQILFDHENNILACDEGGVLCFDGDTYQKKALPFQFPYKPSSYDFVDFLYDRKNERYIIAWAEPSQRIEMIPEETATLEGVPNMKVSIFSADGLLLTEYDTKHIVPSLKVFDRYWPRLRLGDAGLELVGSFSDGRKRTFLSVPLSD